MAHPCPHRAPTMTRHEQMGWIAVWGLVGILFVATTLAALL